MEYSAVLLTCIKIPHGFQTFVLSIFEWPLKTGFTVCKELNCNDCDLYLFFLQNPIAFIMAKYVAMLEKV